MSHKRQAHLLSKIKASTIPNHIIFVDTETIQEQIDDKKTIHKLRLGVAIYLNLRRDGHKDVEQLFRFTTQAEFWRWALQRTNQKSVLHLISHNAVFDFVVLGAIEHLTSSDYECLFLYEGGVTFIAKWRKRNRTIVILDNANWFKGKLAKWGDELKLPKLKMPENAIGNERWFIYCERDTRILVELFKWYIRFLRSDRLGMWKYTIASSAFTSFRHRFMSHPIYIPDDGQEQAMARESYHGGRTECFRIGEYTNATFYKVDINSMYPYVMRVYSYPTNFSGYANNPSITKISQSIGRYGFIARAQVKTGTPYFVCKRDNRNVYPIGSFTTTLTTPEIKMCIDNNWLITIESCAWYRMRNIFAEYVDFFYEVKLQAGDDDKPLLKSFAKLYLNSLYGKFGQRGFVDKHIGRTKDFGLKISYGINAQTGKRFVVKQIGKDVLYSEKGDEGYNSFCAIASHVTAYARLMLYDLVLIAGRANTFYVDTDSLIVNEIGYQKLSHLMDTRKLGFLKLEGKCNHIHIVAPKHYFFENHWTRKGVRNTAIELGKNHFVQEIWHGFNYYLKNGVEQYVTEKQHKKLAPSIVSGNVTQGGFVEPFTL